MLVLYNPNEALLLKNRYCGLVGVGKASNISPGARLTAQFNMSVFEYISGDINVATVALVALIVPIVALVEFIVPIVPDVEFMLVNDPNPAKFIYQLNVLCIVSYIPRVPALLKYIYDDVGLNDTSKRLLAERKEELELTLRILENKFCIVPVVEFNVAIVPVVEFNVVKRLST